ncbi:hypothetical protein CC2G_003198 [Coprinopsis cinerea AmutBmut pab1-1]|nr:hypothetical protein CC2G_003198 [Coprinopsis cinerea AmutBmut pab1-1]
MCNNPKYIRLLSQTKISISRRGPFYVDRLPSLPRSFDFEKLPLKRTPSRFLASCQRMRSIIPFILQRIIA